MHSEFWRTIIHVIGAGPDNRSGDGALPHIGFRKDLSWHNRKIGTTTALPVYRFPPSMGALKGNGASMARCTASIMLRCLFLVLLTFSNAW